MFTKPCCWKGVIKTIRDKFPDSNIVPVDYDPGASEANQTNRIKLLMTVAKDNLKLKEKQKKAVEKENVEKQKKVLEKENIEKNEKIKESKNSNKKVKTN